MLNKYKKLYFEETNKAYNKSFIGDFVEITQNVLMLSCTGDLNNFINRSISDKEFITFKDFPRTSSSRKVISKQKNVHRIYQNRSL